MSKKAIIVVDMLNDFVTGSLGFPGALKIVKPNQELIEEARKNNVPVIFANDSHFKGIDYELELWGDHAIRGTPGAEVIKELEPTEKDYIVLKRRYSAFFRTDLELLLHELKVDEVVITGLHTHMCCRHTAADAYCLGYKVTIAEEAINAFTKEDHESGLDYFKKIYGARILKNKEIISEF